jgi:hypothetical protein
MGLRQLWHQHGARHSNSLKFQGNFRVLQRGFKTSSAYFAHEFCDRLPFADANFLT